MCNLSTGRLVQKGEEFEARLCHNNETLPPNSHRKGQTFISKEFLFRNLEDEIKNNNDYDHNNNSLRGFYRPSTH